MTGLAIKIPRAGIGPGVDPIDSMRVNGTLLLVDPSHSSNPWASGVPANGSTVPNIAWDKLAAVLGTGAQSDLAATVDYTTSFTATDATKRGAIQRSGKGGLHVAVSQASALVAADGAHIQAPAALRTYLAANPTHAYFASIWGRYTRINGGSPTSANSTPSAEVMSIGLAGTTGSRIALYRAGSAYTLPVTGQRLVNDNVAGAPFLANAQATQAGTPANAARVGWGAGTGTLNAAALANKNNLWPSFILYRWYVEDLTVSGRLYADVDALDLAAFNAATTGTGRYASDTFTDPATLAA